MEERIRSREPSNGTSSSGLSRLLLPLSLHVSLTHTFCCQLSHKMTSLPWARTELLRTEIASPISGAWALRNRRAKAIRTQSKKNRVQVYDEAKIWRWRGREKESLKKEGQSKRGLSTSEQRTHPTENNTERDREGFRQMKMEEQRRSTVMAPNALVYEASRRPYVWLEVRDGPPYSRREKRPSFGKEEGSGVVVGERDSEHVAAIGREGRLLGTCRVDLRLPSPLGSFPGQDNNKRTRVMWCKVIPFRKHAATLNMLSSGLRAATSDIDGNEISRRERDIALAWYVF